MKLSFGIYKRNLIFFLIFFIVLGGIFYLVRKQLSYASINEIASPTVSNEYIIDVELFRDGRVKINDKYYNKFFIPGRQFNEFRYVAAEREGNYIDRLEINLHLPSEVNENDVEQKVYGVHGVGSQEYYYTDSKTLTYVATNLSPSATFTVYAKLPKEMFELSFSRKIIFYFYNLPGSVWLMISIALPIVALVILLMMFKQSLDDWKIKKPKSVLKSPPSNLSPAEAGVLLEGKVSARSIAAILLDLAQREFIQVSSNKGVFNFFKKRPAELGVGPGGTLRPFEKILLSKIFDSNEQKSSLEDIHVRIGRHVFSRKIAEVYLEIYRNITAKGYFMENPSVMHQRYRNFGLISFFVALLGFIFGIFFAPEPKFLLIFWAAMIFTSFIIIRLSPQLPNRTFGGKKELQEWLKFKNYLTEESPIGYLEGTQKLFEKYLPYAIAMRCEVEWARRFIEHPFQIPEWYLSNKPVVILEDFINDLFPVIGFVSKELAASKEPIV